MDSDERLHLWPVSFKQQKKGFSSIMHQQRTKGTRAGEANGTCDIKVTLDGPEQHYRMTYFHPESFCTKNSLHSFVIMTPVQETSQKNSKGTHLTFRSVCYQGSPP